MTRLDPGLDQHPGRRRRPLDAAPVVDGDQLDLVAQHPAGSFSAWMARSTAVRGCARRTRPTGPEGLATPIRTSRRRRPLPKQKNCLQRPTKRTEHGVRLRHLMEDSRFSGDSLRVATRNVSDHVRKLTCREFLRHAPPDGQPMSGRRRATGRAQGPRHSARSHRWAGRCAYRLWNTSEVGCDGSSRPGGRGRTSRPNAAATGRRAWPARVQRSRCGARIGATTR